MPFSFESAMPLLFNWDLATALIFLLFIWSGFVRTGLGFGGALLTMPFIMLVDNRPLVYLPIIAMQLLVFSPLSLLNSHRQNKHLGGFLAGVDWRYLKRCWPFLLVPKIIGVLGLVNLPSQLLSPLIYTIVFGYGLAYITNTPIRSPHPYADVFLLALGAYISGTSLMGGPLIMAVFIRHVAQAQLRDTLFVLWFVLVLIKMVSFYGLGVSLQWHAQLWLLPAAFIGHFLGQAFHHWLARTSQVRFFRVMGASLIAASAIGLWQSTGP